MLTFGCTEAKPSGGRGEGGNHTPSALGPRHRLGPRQRLGCACSSRPQAVQALPSLPLPFRGSAHPATSSPGASALLACRGGRGPPSQPWPPAPPGVHSDEARSPNEGGPELLGGVLTRHRGGGMLGVHSDEESTSRYRGACAEQHAFSTGRPKDTGARVQKTWPLNPRLAY